MEPHLNIKEHFEKVAKDYDYWKRKNWYYYDALKAIARQFSVGAQRVLDAGSGTGGIVSDLSVPSAVGFDISKEMISIAKERYRNRGNLEFFQADIMHMPKEIGKFNVILFFDVVEHITNHSKAFENLASLLSPQGRLVVTMANPLWEPALMVAEKLSLKMPEGPHYRISLADFRSLLDTAGLEIVLQDTMLLFPIYIPFVSNFINQTIGRLPFVKHLGVIKIFVAIKKM